MEKLFGVGQYYAFPKENTQMGKVVKGVIMVDIARLMRVRVGTSVRVSCYH